MVATASPLAEPAPSKTSPAVAWFRNGSNPGKLSRYRSRVAWMIRYGATWTYYPEDDLFEEKVSTQPAHHSPTGRARFIPSLRIYGREVYELSDADWNRFISAHPQAIALWSADFLPKSPGGIFDVDAYAMDREGRIGGGSGGASR